MLGSRTRPDVDEALGALARASRSLSVGAPLEPTLAELAAAAAQGTGAEVAVLWLPERGGTLGARSVWSSSAGLAAELEGLRVEAIEMAAQLLEERLGDGAHILMAPLEAAAGRGMLALARREPQFDRGERRFAELAADLAGLASRLGAGSTSAGFQSLDALDVVGDALTAVSGDESAGARIARLAAIASGGDAALVWRLRDEKLAPEGEYGAVGADTLLETAARATVEEPRAVAVDPLPRGHLLTLQLGQPALGALQIRFAPGRLPDEQGREQLAHFAVRAAHALRSSERAQDAGLELERSRALVAVVGEAIARLSLEHTLDTAIERVADLLLADRVAIYLTEDGRMTAAASRGVDGPHEAIAEALLEASLRARPRASIIELDDATREERLGHVRAQAEEAGIRSVLALGLLVGDEPIGLLAVYPRTPRPLSENERALLTALTAQLAVAVQNARLHDRVTALYDELKQALASEREKSSRLHAQHEISRSFAQGLPLDKTLDVLASAIVELLGVDAAVIRLPDERGAEYVVRALHVNDERADAAVRALLWRPQQLPRRTLLRLLEQDEPLVLDAARAEALGGAMALLAPFLRKGSSAAIIPIATATELLATLTIVSLHPGRPVAGEVARTALAIAGQAALAIDNARLYGQQKAFAETMQRSLLPREAPMLVGLELGAVYQSAARVGVGGDVYDYVTLGDGRLAVILGDVTGHGVDAAADMAMAKYVFRSLARDHPDPGGFLAAVNDVVSSEIAPGRFITMVELVFDGAAGEVACASGGHPHPRLVLPDGTVDSIPAKGLALGIDAPQRYETVTALFPPGAIVVAYTDGVVEARRHGEQFGVAQLDALLAEKRRLPPPAIADAALEACREWSEGELGDDVAVVVVKRTESG